MIKLDFESSVSVGYDDYWDRLANNELEIFREAQRRELLPIAMADQLPPPALAIGRTVTPRARCNLPAGIRFRGVGPNATAAN